MARAEYLDKVISEKEKVRDDLLEQFMDWKGKEGEFETLLDNTVEALCPEQFLDEHPLNQMPEESMSWLREVIHALYLERTEIKVKTLLLKEMLNHISKTHVLLLEILQGKNSDLMQKAGINPFQGFYKNVEEFSKAISALPHGVQVV